MFRLLCNTVLLFLLFTSLTTPASADCWNIQRNDGSKLHTTAIWHLQNKLLDTPQAQLIGKQDGKDRFIATGKIDSITVKAAGGGWLHAGEYNTRITLRNGQHLLLTMKQSLQYQKNSKHSGTIPLKNIDQINHCTSSTSEHTNTKIAKTAAATTVNNALLTIHLNNNDTFRGTPASDIKWKSAYGLLMVEPSQIESLKYDTDKASGLIILKSGDHINGKLESDRLSIRLSIGQTIIIPRQNIQTISSGSRKTSH